MTVPERKIEAHALDVNRKKKAIKKIIALINSDWVKFYLITSSYIATVGVIHSPESEHNPPDRIVSYYS